MKLRKVQKNLALDYFKIDHMQKAFRGVSHDQSALVTTKKNLRLIKFNNDNYLMIHQSANNFLIVNKTFCGKFLYCYPVNSRFSVVSN